MLSNDGYAVKKRKKPVQKIKPTSEVALSNPSKRHRDRLNGELERLTNLLPFPENVRCRLDKLSVLRLSVGYLKVKSFFNAAMQKNGAGSPAEHDMDTDWLNDPEFSEGELLLQSLNGFVLVVSAEGYVFYASPTIMDYLGFRQSDVIHQSVYELIHVDDRAIFCRQLHFALNPESFSGDQGEDDMQISSDITRNIVTYDPQHIPPENSSFLERSFVCRFRCLLDNSSGFLALNFQGRLKYLHGQQKRNADGTAAPPQLALFAVATPVQPPSILEIRTKTLIFQTKHKLDFTPLGIDTRGKVVLGYTEMELCMRGSGYQFIHAADMMYCADNHIRMMKTGESGLTVFRLLSKTGEWIWVQANAKLVYKGGKPDFIIARQRALANEEGEEHLRQRKLQLPFSFTTGEAVLYETNPSPDVTDFQHNDKVPTPGKDLAQNALDPDSLLGCMLKQDKSVYLNEAEPQLCADNVFMDTQALLSVPSDSWQEETPKAVDVKEESAVVAMIDTLEQMAQNRDLYTALQKLDVDSVELKEWENVLLRLTREASGSEKALSLDDILTNDIISCVEDILLKDSNKCHVAPPKPSNGMKDPLAGLPTEFPANQLIPDFGLSGGQNFDCKSPAVNGLNQQELGLGSVGTPGQAVTGAPNIARGTERLSRPEHSSSGLNVPSLQQLQLKDILPPSLEIPDISDLNGSCQNGNFSFGPSMIGSCTQAQSRNQVSMATPSASSFIQSNSYGIYHQKKMQDHPSCTVDQFMEERYGISSIQHQPNMFQNQSNNNTYLQNSLNQLDHALGNGVSNVISNNCDQNASPVQAMDFAGPQTTGEHCIPDVPNPLQNTYLQSCPSFESQINRTQGQCTQLQPDQPSPNAIQSRFTPDGFVQARKTQRISQVGPWLQTSPSCREECRNLSNGIYHSPQGGLANNQPSPLRSCMFENFSPSYTNGDNLHGSGQAVTISSCWKTRIPNNQSPPQASCYFQWSQNQPVEGTSSISQEDACISPPSFPGISSPETVMEQYLGCNGQTHITSHPMALHGAFSSPLVNKMYFPEGSQASCFNA